MNRNRIEWNMISIVLTIRPRHIGFHWRKWSHFLFLFHQAYVINYTWIQNIFWIFAIIRSISVRPTEIDESDVYVVQYKVAGREPPANRCSIMKTEYLTKNDMNAMLNLTDNSHISGDDSQDNIQVDRNRSVNTASHSLANNVSSYEPMSESSARKLKNLKVILLTLITYVNIYYYVIIRI